MSKRIGISKSTRFAIFSRDGFTCRYCGRQSDAVKLVVDHVIPVCQGGTNDKENLVTSCEDCNQGKGGKTIAQAAPTETDRLRLIQEHREQMALARAALESARARKALRQEICNYYCEAKGDDSMSKRVLNVLASFAEEYGPELVFEWIDIAMDRVGRHRSDNNIGRYISGIRRNFINNPTGAKQCQ